MKKSMWMAACAVCAVSLVASASLDLDIVATDLGGDQWQIDIYGELVGETTDGLALFGCNLTISDGSDLGAILDLDAPAGMASFDRNDGLTNPPGPTNSGYGGTAAGDTLLQIGGGQNTIGNTSPPVYPVGTVLEGVAVGGQVLLATGVIDTSALTLPVTLTVDAGFANILDADQAGPVYSVTPVATVNGDAVTLDPVTTVDVVDVFSMATHAGTEEGIQIYPAQIVFGQPYNCEPRFGLTENKLEIGLSGVIADASGITVTATDSASNVSTATVALDPAGDMLVATFSPLTNAKIYTIDVTGGAVNDFDCEMVVLVGNLTNMGTANGVDVFDKTLLIARLGKAYTETGVGPAYDIARIGASDGMVDVFDKTVLISRLGNVAN